MKKTFLRALLASLLLGGFVAGAARAEGNMLRFDVGLGARVAPNYEGSADYSVRPAGGGVLRGLNFGRLKYEKKTDRVGFFVGPSMLFRPTRTAADAPELAGFADVNWAFELGLVAGIEWRNALVFAAVRKGIGGHTGWTGELGADAISRPTDKLTLRFGPRIAFADSGYMDTYFSVPTTATVLPAYTAGSGLKSFGAALTARYQLNENWSVDGLLEYTRLAGTAASSPIVRAGSPDQLGVRLLLVRQFTLRF